MFTKRIRKVSTKLQNLKYAPEFKKRILTFIVGACTGPILFFMLANLVFYIRTGEVRSSYANSEIRQYILSDFSDKYDVSIEEQQLSNFGSPTVIAYANDKNIKDFCPRLYEEMNNIGPKVTLGPAILRVYEKRSELFSLLFPFLPPYRSVLKFSPEISAPATSSSDGDSMFDLPFIYSLETLDLNDDNQKEVVVTLMSPTCGSGTQVFNLIFGFKDGDFTLLASLPDVGFFEGQEPGTYYDSLASLLVDAKKNGWEIKALFEEATLKSFGQDFTVRAASSDDFIGYKDLDKDGIFELVVAQPILKFPEECHWCPHKWRIGVYKYRNNDFNGDNRFNRSLLLETKEKYTLFDVFGYKPIPHNGLGMISAYYGLGHVNLRSDNLDFDYRERTASVIWKLVAEHYDFDQ